MQPLQDEQTLESGGLILSSANGTGVARVPHEAELATMRQMMETLFSHVEALQQNQAMQFAGVHDRLDAVELELPLIQEQGALRIRDLEVRMSGQIEEAARSAVEEVTAGLQEDVTSRFGSLAAQIENQHKELSQMRESKKVAESKLERAIQDIERLCGNLAPRPAEEVRRPVVEAVASPFRTRIAEHIRKAAVEAAPDESNPLVGSGIRSQEPVGRPASPSPPPRPLPPQPVVAAAPVEKRVPVEKGVPGFDDWKRQFMQEGEPLNPTLSGESERHGKAVLCPRCYSERTRPATHNRLDGLFRLTGFFPHRCRSCSHRFYKREGSARVLQDEEGADSHTEEALESR